jgi:hypothetical protein
MALSQRLSLMDGRISLHPSSPFTKGSDAKRSHPNSAHDHWPGMARAIAHGELARESSEVQTMPRHCPG